MNALQKLKLYITTKVIDRFVNIFSAILLLLKHLYFIQMYLSYICQYLLLNNK